METEVSIKDYVDVRCDAINDHFTSILNERSKAEERSVSVLDERLSKMNDIREQLTHQYADFNFQMGKYLSKDEYGGKHDSLVADVRKIEEMFRQYTSLVEFQTARVELKMLVEWKANMAGRLWALGIGLALLQVLLTTFRWTVLAN